MGELITKKGKKKEATAPVMDIKEAKVQILSANFLGVGDTVEKNDGTTFTVEKPRIDCELQVLDAPARRKNLIGTKWFEKFHYVETEKGSGEWENRPGTKIGNLTTALYGEGWEEKDDVYLKPEDLVDFAFYCTLEPKTEFGGTKVVGTQINYKSIEPLEEADEDLELPDWSGGPEEAGS
jgi:hypothetical protein